MKFALVEQMLPEENKIVLITVDILLFSWYPNNFVMGSNGIEIHVLLLLIHEFIVFQKSLEILQLENYCIEVLS